MIKMSKAQEFMQKYREKEILAARDLLGRWVVGDSEAIETALVVIPQDDEYNNSMQFAKKFIFKVIEVDGLRISCPSVPGFNGFPARYVKPIEFSGDNPTPEEVKMYKMLGYIFIGGEHG